MKDNGDPTSVCQPITRWRVGGQPTVCEDDLAHEEPLEIRVRGKAISVTMRTPGHDDELAAGFLLTEGMIRGAADISRIEPCARPVDGNVINVFLAPHVEVDFDKLSRHVFASSSCGLCGKTSIDAIHGQFEPVQTDVSVDAAVLLGLPQKLRQSQSVFDRTGGLHAAAVFDSQGKLLVAREDVGRHNAVDKVLGHVLMNPNVGPWPLDQHILQVSGRASFEIVQKALAAGIAIVSAVSAPSSLAVDFAEQSNQSLVGFVRDDGFNVYTHPKRIVFAR